jgi:predicted nuclease of predicted toxin-antitoxin system
MRVFLTRRKVLKTFLFMKLPNLIVADECVEEEIIERLRDNNIRILSIRESHSGIKDVEVLAIAVDSSAFLLTEDKDFGELVFRLHQPHNGILLVRFPNDYDPDIKAQKVVKIILEKFEEIDGFFAVLDENRLRVKR